MYLLREDMYNEWAWENGATDIICLSNNINTIQNKLQEKLDEYINRDYIIEVYDDKKELSELTKQIDNKTSLYIDIYESQYDYDNGKNMSTFVISYEKIID